MLPKNVSYDQARQAIESLICPPSSSPMPAMAESAPWVREIFDDHVIYQAGRQKFSQRYQFNDAGAAELIGKPTEVTEKTTYVPAKTMTEMKAEPMTTVQLDNWLSGKIARRILVLPFGGPIPSAKSSIGVDLDNEWFDGDTDAYGPYPGLKASRERLVDWHHTTFASGSHSDPAEADKRLPSMRGAILAKAILDEGPESASVDGIEYAGIWADLWANLGEKRRELVGLLERRGVPIYGSSQPVAGGVRKAKSGHIDVWPIYRHTLSTSPQNTFAVVPSLKAVLGGASSLEEIGWPALKAALTGLDDNLASDLSRTSGMGDGTATGGRVSIESALLEESRRQLAALRRR